MSWYMFKQAPAVKFRGIKVEGFQQMHRPKLNLSWGMNEKSSQQTLNAYEKNIIPSTIVSKLPVTERQAKKEVANNIKVLTETSDDEDDELMKLIKKRDTQKHEIQSNNNRVKNRSNSLQNMEYEYNTNSQHQTANKNSEFSKRIRYLENSLLPDSRKDSMGTILDHKLSKQVPLSQSRMSSKSNKKNESSVVLGSGFNPFIATQQKKKDLTQQLQEMYQYQQRCKRRISHSQFALG